MEDTVLTKVTMMLRYSNTPESNKTLQVGDFEIFDSCVKT